MRNIILTFSAIIFFSTVIFAQHFQIGFQLPVVPKNNYINTGNGINLSIEYLMQRGFSVKTDFGGISSTTLGGELTNGTYSQFWAEASLVYRLKYNLLQPYVGAGFGYYKTDINIIANETFTLDNYGKLREDNLQYKTGYNFRLGADWFLSSRFIINTQFKYIIFEPNLNSRIKIHGTNQIDSTTKQISLDSFVIQVGFAIYI